MRNTHDLRAYCNLYLPFVLCVDDGWVSKSGRLLWSYQKWFRKRPCDLNAEDILEFIHTVIIFTALASILCNYQSPVVVALLLCFISIPAKYPIQFISRSSAQLWYRISQDILIDNQPKYNDVTYNDLCNEEFNNFRVELNSEWQDLFKSEAGQFKPQLFGTFKGIHFSITHFLL